MAVGSWVWDLDLDLDLDWREGGLRRWGGGVMLANVSIVSVRGLSLCVGTCKREREGVVVFLICRLDFGFRFLM
jgi:hypothetical protein